MPSSPIPDFDRMSVGGSRFLSFSTKFNQMHPDSALAQKLHRKVKIWKTKKQKPISQIFGNFILTGMCIYFLILSNDFKKTDHAVGISRITDRRGMLNYVYQYKGSKQNGKKDSLF